MHISSKSAVCRSIFGVVNGVQLEPVPDDRLAGITCTLLLACRATGKDLSQVIQQAERILKDAEVYAPAHLRAAQDYVANEL